MVAELYTVFGSELLNYCCMMCRNIGDAQDLLQETFLKALSYQDLLESMETKQRRAWLYKVARNLFYDQCRRRAVEKNIPLRQISRTIRHIPRRRSAFCFPFCHLIYQSCLSSTILRVITQKS